MIRRGVMREKISRLRWVPMFLVMGTIFYLSHQPGDSLHLPDITDLDKLLHGMAYGVLAASVLFALSPARYRHQPVRAGAGVVLFCLLYGISDEFHQSFIPGRCPSAADLVADTLGAALVVTVVLTAVRCRTLTPPVR